MDPQLTELIESEDGKPKLRFHPHAGQWRAYESDKRFVLVLAGTQGGKTSFGPLWLWKEIKNRGPGDYLVVTPTYPLMELKALPEFLSLFKRRLNVGEYTGSPSRRFAFSESVSKELFGSADTPTNVYFGYAADPDSLEAATAKAAWLDEAGQKKFKLGSWEAIQRRLSINEGRALITTTPYDLGWLKQKLFDPWQAANGKHPLIDVIRFDSTENPAFPRAEFERARDSLPRWKFDLFYRAIFTRPAGLIYDCFDFDRFVVPRFCIPDRWPRYLGMDFGGVNTAGMFYAEEPGTDRLYAYREYKAGGRTAKEHTAALLDGEPGLPSVIVGGSHSEGQWRDEFCAAGLPVREPAVKEVEVGIDRVYGAHKRGEIFVFFDLAGYLEEKGTYSRVVNDAGEVQEAIDDKHSFHFMDAERYIVGYLRPPNSGPWIISDHEQNRSVFAEAPEGVFLP